MTIQDLAQQLIDQGYWGTGKEGAACRICGQITGFGFGHKDQCVVAVAQRILGSPHKFTERSDFDIVHCAICGKTEDSHGEGKDAPVQPNP